MLTVYTTKLLRTPSELDEEHPGVDLLQIPGLNVDGYLAGFVVSERAKEATLRLRYEVFNLELNEGLMTSHVTGLDMDSFDQVMHHLVVVEKATQRMVGTYRLQPASRALANLGFYSATEYDFTSIQDLIRESVECGRACVAREHRTLPVLLLLWKGLGAYQNFFNMPLLFGCCSLTTIDPDDGWRAKKTLREGKMLHDEINLAPVEGYSCGDPSREFADDLGPAIPLPKLFSAYMRLGAKVVSEPALDRAFGTVDFLVMMDSRGKDLAVIAENILKRMLNSRNIA